MRGVLDGLVVGDDLEDSFLVERDDDGRGTGGSDRDNGRICRYGGSLGARGAEANSQPSRYRRRHEQENPHLIGRRGNVAPMLHPSSEVRPYRCGPISTPTAAGRTSIRSMLWPNSKGRPTAAFGYIGNSTY